MTPQQRHQFDTARLEARRHGKQARHHARLRAQQIIQEIRAELDQQKETTMTDQTSDRAADLHQRITAALTEVDAVIAANPDHGEHYPGCHEDHVACLAARFGYGSLREVLVIAEPDQRTSGGDLP